MRLSGFKLPVEHLSASSLAKAVACPEQWRRRYLLHERETFGIDRFVGSVDHETIEYLLNEKMQGRDWNADQLDEAFVWLWHSLLEKEEDVLWGAESPDKLQERGKAMVKLYHEQVVPTLAPIAVEKEFLETIPGVPIPLLGYLDVETQTQVIERKTAKTKLSVPKPNWSFQAKIYGLVTSKPIVVHLVTKQVTPQLVIGGPENPGLIIDRGNPDHTVRQIQQIVYQLNDFYQRYGPNEPWPTLGTLHDWRCSYCHYKTRGCAAWRHLDSVAC